MLVPLVAPAAPPAPLVVADVAGTYARVPVAYRGIGFEPATLKSWDLRSEYDTAVFPKCGTNLVFVLRFPSNAVARSVHVEGRVTDYLGDELGKVAFDVPVKAGETVVREVSVQPAPAQLGPFYLRGQWSVANEKLQGEFAAEAGQPNCRLVLEDFELVRYPEPEAGLLSAPEARHRGAMGLSATLDTLPRGRAKSTNEPPDASVTVPFDRELPGRPVKLGVWLKPSVPVRVLAHLRDPGIEVNQSMRPDTWTVGPVPVAAGAWQYVEIPMPAYGRPKAEAKQYGEANGVADYPLTLDKIEFEGALSNTVMVDDLEVWTQTEPEHSLALRLGFDKPEGLLYPDDTVGVTVANGWLWGHGEDVHVTASLRDIAGRVWPLQKATVPVAPGAEAVLPSPVQHLPLGGYDVVGEALAPQGVCTQAEAQAAALVYEPGGGRPGHRELRALLADRDRLAVDLGFKSDTVLVPWHSLDGSPAVEPTMGLWRFDWIAPELEARKAAGLEVIGRLGFTPEWAGTEAMWNVKMGAWYGNSTVMPVRSAYWEEYVLRTVERFAGVIDTWIVWERPDSGALHATAEEFAEKLLEVASKAAKEANPKARIVSGGITRENIEKYLIALSETGVSRYMDGIGILPTSAPLSPEDGDLEVVLSRAQRIRRQEQLQPELWVLNLDWATGEGRQHVSEFDQARYVARAYGICRAHGIREIHLQANGTPLESVRDSASFLFVDGPLYGVKPAALAARTARTLLEKSEYAGEVFLNDRRDDIARCYLFRPPDGGVVMAAWRREGESTLALPRAPAQVLDIFGNPLALPAGPHGPELVLRPEPRYAVFEGVGAEELMRALTRAPLQYADAPESAWKAAMLLVVDVGDAADEKAAGYSATNSRVVGPIDSYYHTEYGRHVVDSGRRFVQGDEEHLRIDVSHYGKADLLLRRRVDFAVPDQRMKVYCNDQYVGQWFTWKSDPRYRWRDAEFVVPNRFFAGQPAAELRIAAQSEATSFAYWAGPLNGKTVYLSDLSLLVATSGYGAGALRDKNILGGPLRFYKQPDASIAKGIGTMGAANPSESLVVVGLNQQVSRFKARVGIDTAASGRGSVRFRVTVGSPEGLKTVYDSKDMTYYSDPQDIDLDVSNGIVLMLWAGDAGDGNEDDMANWANARLELK